MCTVFRMRTFDTSYGDEVTLNRSKREKPGGTDAAFKPSRLDLIALLHQVAERCDFLRRTLGWDLLDEDHGGLNMLVLRPPERN